MAKRKPRAKNVYFTPEPDWKSLMTATTEEERANVFREADYFTRTEIADKKKIQVSRDWIKNKSPWTSKDKEIILANPDWAFSATSSIFFIESKLGFIPEKVMTFLQRRKEEEWIPRGRKALVEKKEKVQLQKEKPKVSIQDRMREQISDLCGDIEYFLDELIDGDKALKEFEPYKMMMSYQPEVKMPHAKLIKEEFSRGHEEAIEVIEWQDEQIKEAYSNFTLKQRKDYLQYFEMINTACDTIIQTKATTRKARKPKAKSKEKIVTKLKFKVNDPELGVASVPPTDIVYASECWVYNVKTRKIGVYKAKDPDPKNLRREGSGLNVKGTTLQGFCEESSVQKTLRKPKEQLKSFEGAKTACKNSFEAIKTTDTKMNGRFNEHTIILKTF